MGFPENVLADDEQVELKLRPHIKVLLRPVLFGVLILAGGGGLAALATNWAGWLSGTFALVTLGLFVIFAVWPFLRWITTNYVITTHRVLLRHGVIARNGRDIPLGRINDVSFEHGLIDRLLGCGTLVIESAGERGQVILLDVPKVEAVQSRLYQLVEDDSDRRTGQAEDAPPVVTMAERLRAERAAQREAGA